VHYSEGLDVGYRAYAAHSTKPLFPFGYGLSLHAVQFRRPQGQPATGQRQRHRKLPRNQHRKTRRGRSSAVVPGFPPIAEGNEPPLQLIDFRKIMLNPGESKPVELKLEARSFSYWSEKTHAWQNPTGAFQIMVGGLIGKHTAEDDAHDSLGRIHI